MLCAMYGRWYIGMLLGVLGATGFDMPCFVRIYLCDISCRVFQSFSSDGSGWRVPGAAAQCGGRQGVSA